MINANTVSPRTCLIISVVCLALCFILLGAISCEAQERQPDKTLRLVQWSIVGAELADAITTHRAIQSGAGREGNPGMVWATKNPYVLSGVKLGIALGMNYAIGKIAKHNRTAALVLGASIAGSVSAIAVRNSRIR